MYKDTGHSLDHVIAGEVHLVDLPGDGGHKLAGVGLAEGVEGVALVLREQPVPLLEELVQVVRHLFISARQLVAEGVA